MYMLAGFASLLVGVYLVFRLGRHDDTATATTTGDPT